MFFYYWVWFGTKTTGWSPSLLLLISYLLEPRRNPRRDQLSLSFPASGRPCRATTTPPPLVRLRLEPTLLPDMPHPAIALRPRAHVALAKDARSRLFGRRHYDRKLKGFLHPKTLSTDAYCNAAAVPIHPLTFSSEIVSLVLFLFIPSSPSPEHVDLMLTSFSYLCVHNFHGKHFFFFEEWGCA